MKRFHDWEKRLDDVFASRETTEFARGSHDCALFACDCIQAMTGIDPGEWFRGRYNTQRGAASALKEYGGTLEQVAEKRFSELGMQETHPCKAQRGDVVLISNGQSQALGIVDLSGSHIALADKGQPVGVARVPLSMAKRAWRV